MEPKITVLPSGARATAFPVCSKYILPKSIPLGTHAEPSQSYTFTLPGTIPFTRALGEPYTIVSPSDDISTVSHVLS